MLNKTSQRFCVIELPRNDSHVFLNLRFNFHFTQANEVMTDKDFFAHAQWWDSWTVHVKCPFCLKIHKHCFDGSYEGVYRIAHCDSSPPLLLPLYQLKFPFSQALETTAYKIDKGCKRYVAIDADMPQSRPDLLKEAYLPQENPAVALETFEDAVETITIDKTDKIFRRLHEAFGGDETSTVIRIEHVLSQMIFFRDEDYVREYLDSSPESRIFLHGVRDDNGESALSCAACERFPAIVKLLLERGSNANFQNRHDGRTALMQAALWGRYENVRHLLKYGAIKNLKDSNGFKAIDFAYSSDGNEEERYRRLGENQTYREVTPTANLARRMIVHLLKDAEDEIVHSPNNSFENHVFQKHSKNIFKLVAPIAEYPISNEWKTIARLERGHKYPSVAAMSGWGHGNTTATISGRDWTTEVLRIADILDYAIKPHEKRDDGIPGQYHACHAEMQLTAYLISEHVFLEPEIRGPKTISDPTDPQNPTKEDLKDGSSTKAELETDKRGPLYELATIMPPAKLKRATILVSIASCESCSQFNNFVNQKLGLSISLLNCSGVR